MKNNAKKIINSLPLILVLSLCFCSTSYARTPLLQRRISPPIIQPSESGFKNQEVKIKLQKVTEKITQKLTKIQSRVNSSKRIPETKRHEISSYIDDQKNKLSTFLNADISTREKAKTTASKIKETYIDSMKTIKNMLQELINNRSSRLKP